jgi:hypothetical protein
MYPPPHMQCILLLIDVSFNLLYALPHDIGRLTGLTILRLAYNDLELSSMTLDTLQVLCVCVYVCVCIPPLSDFRYDAFCSSGRFQWPSAMMMKQCTLHLLHSPPPFPPPSELQSVERALFYMASMGSLYIECVLSNGC